MPWAKCLCAYMLKMTMLTCWCLSSIMFNLLTVLGTVYMAQVFTSNKTLLLRFSMLTPLKLQTFETRFQSAIFWNCNLLSSSVNLLKAKSVTVMTTLMLMLMLMLAQVNAFCSSHHQTPINHSAVHRKQVSRLLRCDLPPTCQSITLQTPTDALHLENPRFCLSPQIDIDFHSKPETSVKYFSESSQVLTFGGWFHPRHITVHHECRHF